jgi:hypothetical protein
MEAEIDALEKGLDESAEIPDGIPHYLGLSHRLPRKLIAAYREWIGEVAAELGDWALIHRPVVGGPSRW